MSNPFGRVRRSSLFGEAVNRASRFVEVAVYVVGGWKEFILFSEGRDGWGESRVTGELSRALSFFEATLGSTSSDDSSLVGKEKIVGIGLGSNQEQLKVCSSGARVVMNIVGRGGEKMVMVSLEGNE